jgi:tRNA(fMet)-specific endonuclease VapC
LRLALDTNRYIDLCKGVDEAVVRLRAADRIFVPIVVVAELRAGFACGSRQEANERNLTKFLGSPRVEVICPDEATTHHYARLFAQLRKQGTPIPTNDLWIAALVVQYDLQLFARDRHFHRVPQLALL